MYPVVGGAAARHKATSTRKWVVEQVRGWATAARNPDRFLRQFDRLT